VRSIRAAGLELLADAEGLWLSARRGTADARLSPAAKHVIHTVGPIWRGGAAVRPAILTNCYGPAWRLPGNSRFRAIAFPAIATGFMAFHAEQAAQIAVAEVTAHLGHDELPRR